MKLFLDSEDDREEYWDEDEPAATTAASVSFFFSTFALDVFTGVSVVEISVEVGGALEEVEEEEEEEEEEEAGIAAFGSGLFVN